MCAKKIKKKAVRLHRFAIKMGVFILCMAAALLLLFFIGYHPGAEWLIEHGFEGMTMAWADIVGEG